MILTVLIVAAAMKRCKELLFSVCGVEIVCCELKNKWRILPKLS